MVHPYSLLVSKNGLLFGKSILLLCDSYTTLKYNLHKMLLIILLKFTIKIYTIKILLKFSSNTFS